MRGSRSCLRSPRASGRYLAAEFAGDRGRMLGLLDDIIAGEQERVADAEDGDIIPLTSRFDMCWAR